MTSQPSGIVLDNPYNTYFAGGTVGGKIVLVLDRPKKVKGILLHIKGAASVKWTVQQTIYIDGSPIINTVTYCGTEDYFEMKYHCIGGREDDTITLPAGTHVYDFACALPSTLPSSFEGPYGNIRYIAKFVIERPWKWNQDTKIAFTVISPYDLNKFPNLLCPAKIYEEKFFCCGYCKSGPLSAIISIPKTGYVSGEKIPVVIEVDNVSSNSISLVTIKFQQLTSFYSQYPSKDVRKDVKVIERMKLGMVKARESKTWSRMILIPPLPPSSLGYCSIIESEYQLFLQVSINALHLSLKATLPVTIGTVPMLVEDHRTVTPPPDYETAMGISVDPGWMGISNSSAPPVQTFGENEAFRVKSIKDDDDGEHTKYGNNSKGYTPYYPMYNFS